MTLKNRILYKNKYQYRLVFFDLDAIFTFSLKKADLVELMKIIRKILVDDLVRGGIDRKPEDNPTGGGSKP